MRNRTFNAVAGFFGVVGSAVAVSKAVRANRVPSTRDLQTLGIDPEQFRSIRF